MTTRRQFVSAGAVVSAGWLLPWKALVRDARADAASDHLEKFVQPLRGVGGAGIPVAQPDTVPQSWWQPGVQHYTIDIGQYEDRLHPALPHPTRLWGYGQGYAPGNPNWTRHLGGIIVARRGTPVQITFRNHLPANHILPVDTTLAGAADAQNRTSTHLHGGFVPWVSDGGPQAWWAPDGNRGPSFVNVLNPVLAPNEAEYYYPNQQGARVVWYHDHALGITRLNAYAGIASAYVISDDYEDSLVANNSLPGPLDARTHYLVFQDKVFVSNSIATTDPGWPLLMPNSRAGDLWYAHEGESETGESLPEPSEVPEFFGDTILVNGSVYPYLEVEPRQYRWRLLNACNARFLNPRLVYARGASFPDNTEPNANAAGPAFVQIGSEGGFLPQPALMNGPKQPTLLLAPAERADLIVDFRDIAPGSTLLLYSDAPAPYPKGDRETDVHPHNPKTPSAIAGYGPNTRTLLQIRVKPRAGTADSPVALPTALTPTDPFLVAQHPGVPTAIPSQVSVGGGTYPVAIRYLTLNETTDALGRLIQFLGTNQPINPGAKNLLFGLEYLAAPTEVIPAGSVEAWEIANLTGDTHPIHFHLVNVQVLSRQAFQTHTFAGDAKYLGPPRAPDANELGWKETVRINPGEVMRVIMKFDLPAVPFSVPLSTTTGVSGHEYVWHCHILEHEEHDMMRPLMILP
jgi:spore coat protein A, manganese oxidase